MRITRIEALALSSDDPGFDQNPTRDVLLVAARTDAGLTGLGECNHHVAAARAFLEAPARFSLGAGVKGVLEGRELRHPAEHAAELEEANLFSARRGIGKAVLAAVDQALWDLWAQARGEPLWRTLWGEAARSPQVYGTVYTGAVDWPQALDALDALLRGMRALPYAALKVEPLPDCAPEAQIGAFVARARAHVGPDLPLLVDFGYRMPDAERALRAIEACAPASPLAIETPIAIDALDEWGRLAERSPIPLAGAELLEHPNEFRDLMDRGVRVLQPWPNRLGVTGTLEVIRDAKARGLTVILAGYNTTPVGIAAGLHLAAGLDGLSCEHAPTSVYRFGLRAAALPDFSVEEGRLPLLDTPGLGARLDPEVVERFRI